MLASVAASVGLGNVMRFPGLCAKYGGGAFILIYFLALIILGVPMLCTEIALGRRCKKSAPFALKSLYKPMEAVGWLALLNSLIVAIFYVAIIGWLAQATINIFPFCNDNQTLSLKDISGYFVKNVLKFNADGAIALSPILTVLTLVAWVVIYFCIKGGASSLSKISRFTVFIPIGLFTALALRGLLYGNSLLALKALFVPDFSALKSVELWQTALGQAFFSLSVLAGVMPAYGSFLPAKAKIFPSAIVVALADFGVSVLASVAFFTAVYGCGLQGAITDSALTTAFSVYPVAIAKLFPNNSVISGIFGVLFYLSIILIALQSTLSMIEAVVVAVKERFTFIKARAIACIILPSAVLSLAFCTNYGQFLVQIFDDIVNRYLILIVGALECVALMIYGDYDQILKEINANCGKISMPKSPFKLSLKYLCPTVIFALILVLIITVIIG